MTNKSIYWEQEKPELIKYNKKKAMGQLLFTTLFSGVASALLIYATAIIFIEGFEPNGQAVEKNYCIWFLVIAVLSMNLWNEWVHLWGKSSSVWKKLIGVVGNLVILFIVLNIPTPDALDSHMTEGLNSLSELYVRWWNYHFGTALRVQSGNADYQLLAGECLLLMFAVILQWLSAFIRKRSVMLLLPVGVLCMEMLVGLTPGWKGLELVFVGGMLALCLDSNRELCPRRVLLLGAATVFAVFLSGKLLRGAADSVYALNEDCLQFQQNLEQGIKNINLKRLLSSGDVVDNQAPVYNGEEVMQLIVSERPQGHIYLRGYHCNDYVNGGWEKDKRSFQKICKEQGISEEEGAALLLQLRYDAAAGSSNSRIQYDLTYTGINSKYCYLPYAAALEGDIADYSFSGDYVIEKSKEENKYKVVGWKQTDYAAVLRGSYGTLSEEDNSFFEWYNAYVKEHYLGVPAKQEGVKSLVSSMKTEAQCREYVDMLNTQLHDKETVNAGRWLLANMVAVRLKSMASYSLELDKLPPGEDAIEYFLTTGKKGFCVHFASAGVLMLRELGVPARYVAGYLVQKERLQGVKGAYFASVLDSDAHAWVEIYLDNYGWVPVEMTGYSAQISEFVAEPEETAENSGESEEVPDSEKEEHNQEEQPESQSAQGAEEGDETHMDSDKENDTSNVRKPSVEADNSNGGGQFSDSGNGADAGQVQAVWGRAYGTMGKAGGVVLSCGAVLLAILCAYAGYQYVDRRRGAKEKLLAGYIRYGYTRKAVVMINRRLYRILAKKTHKGPKKLLDADYLAALKEGFPEIEAKEWERYFEVFRRAAYSQESISQEEAENCHKMYQAVMKFLKK